MYRVLVVDDEKIIRIGLRNLIKWEEYGFKVVEVASDGKQALEIIQNQGIDLVITDIKMPNMDGIAFIKCLKEQKFIGEVIMLTSYGEFELARECIRYGAHDYILKMTLQPGELIQSLEQVKIKLKDKKLNQTGIQQEQVGNKQDFFFIERVFKQQIEDDGTFIEGTLFSTPYVFLLLKHVQSKFEQDKGKDKSFSRYKGAIENIIAEVLPRRERQIILFLEEWCLYMMPSTCVKDKEEVYKLSLQIQNLVKLYTNIKVIGVVSETICTTHELMQSLERSMIVSEMVFYKGYYKVLEEGMYQLMKPYIAEDYMLFKDTLHHAIKEGEYTGASNVIKQYMSLLSEHYISQKKVEEMLNHILNEIILDYGIYLDNDKDERDKIIEKYRKSTLLEEMEREINALIYIICKERIQVRDKNYRKEIKMIIDYIEEHIAEKITLASIAHEVNMNQSYISRLFKSETGMNIVSYINIMKMEKAKKLLKEDNMIVKDVAYALGFEEQSYFNKMFNKYVGTNPKEYKEYTKEKGKIKV